jgi:hypothetical protein
MLKTFLFSIVLMFAMTLTACNNPARIQPTGTDDLIRETWVRQININPNVWINNADHWFLTGEPNLIQRQSERASLNHNITVARVNVADFNQIAVAGDFQVQLVGGQPQNSVYIFGPEEDTQHVSITTSDNKLVLKQAAKCTGNMRNVIVRIGIHNLRGIESLGSSLIMGKTIMSDKLRIISTGAGSILLDGNINLKIVEQRGMGTITVLGVKSQKLNLTVLGNGNVNLSGRVGIENILHNGDGTIHIIGADSDNLCINTTGNGLTTVYGYVNLDKVFADNSSRVYVSWVYSKYLNVMTRSKAIVGVAGATASLDVKTCHTSCFLGEYLRSRTVYVTTKDQSHADVSADQKIFATASNQSGVLYYGSPSILTKFVSHQATVLNVGNHTRPLPNPPFRPYKS